MFQGAKGGGGSFKQTPDNLRSNDTFEGVLGLCIGPIKGPTRGLKSIKLDDTAVENETGELNLTDFTAQVGDGDPAKFPQVVKLKLGAGAAPTNIGVSITNTDGSNPVWVTRTLANTNADFVDMRFIAQQLYRQDKKGIYDLTATLEIQMKPVGSTTWINPTLGTPTGQYNEQGGSKADQYRTYIPESYYGSDGYYNAGGQNYVITGKTTSAAVYELRISLPNEGAYADTAWDIRVRLLERETYTGGTDGADQEKRTISWESMAAVYGDTMGDHEDWRGVAWLQLYGKASDQLTGVPEVEGVYDTKIVSVPSSAIYDADTRQYVSGVWDGSWNKAFTMDPAWVINDAISDSLSGLSLIAPGSYLNKWDALEASKWFSELVSDGDGGTQPRYSLNVAISAPQKADDFIRYLAGAVGALTWDQGDGEWRMKVDKPESAVDIFTLDNIEGEFVYSHTDVDTRSNDIIGKFLNEEMDFREDAVHLYDNPSIALIGRKPTTLALVGCTNRQEAMRRVKLRIRSTVNETRVVSFVTNRRGRNVEPLSTILIADGDLGDQDKRTTGRIVAIASDRMSIAVRDPMRLETSVSYTVRFAVPNENYSPETLTQPTEVDWKNPTVVATRNVTNTSGQRGNVLTIYLDSPLPDDVADDLAVALEATNLVTLPRMYRVTSVVPQDDGERIAISAINIDVGKWDASDNVSKSDTVFQDLRGAVSPPTLIPGEDLLSLIRVPIEQGSQVNLQARWVRPAGAFNSGFRIQYGVNGGPLQTAVERQQLSEWELPNAGPGIYHVEVCTIDRRGGYSLPLVGELEVTQSLIDATEIFYVDDDGLPIAAINDLMPEEAGANVTETHTSADTTAVAGRPAATILTQIDVLEALGTTLTEGAEDLLETITGQGGEIDTLQGQAATLLSDANALLATVTGQGGKIDTLQDAAAALDSRADALESSVTGQGGAISTLQALGISLQGQTDDLIDDFDSLYDDVVDQGTDISTLESTVATQGSAITTNATAITGLNGSLGSLTTTVSTLGTTVTTNSTAISTLDTNYGSLSSTVGTLNSGVSTNALAISNLTTSVGSLTTKVSAGSINLIKNSSFESGLANWNYGGIGAWVVTPNGQSPWGSYASRAGISGTYSYIQSDPFVGYPGNTFTLSADMQLDVLSGTPTAYAYFKWYGPDGFISDSAVVYKTGTFTNTQDGRVRLTATPPTGATAGAAIFLIDANSGSANLHVRQVKVEFGSQMSPWTQESSVFQQAQAIVTAEGQLSSLTTTVSTQGSSITSNATAITGLTSSLGSLTTTVGTLGTTVSTNSTAITTLNTNYGSLTTTVGTLGTTVSTNSTAITTLNTNYGSLSSTVSTLNSSVTSQGTAIGDLNSAVATLSTGVAAGSINLVSNSSFEKGLTGWSIYNTPWATISQENSNWGTFAYTSVPATVDSLIYMTVPVRVAAGYQYTVSFDASLQFVDGGAGKIYPIIHWLDEAEGIVGNSDGGDVAGAFKTSGGFTITQAGRLRMTVTAPTGAVKARVHMYYHAVSGGCYLAVRQLKFEMGAMSTWSQEASVFTQAQSISTLDSQMSSLTSTVSTQGTSITTNATAITTLNTNYGSLSSTVTTLGSTVSTNATALTNLTTSVGTLSSTVTSQGSSITSNSTAITSLTGNYTTLATRSDVIEARASASLFYTKNPLFNAPWTGGIAPSWGSWENPDAAYADKWPSGTGLYGPNALQLDRAGLNAGAVQSVYGTYPRGWYVMEVEVRLEDGATLGSGFHVNFVNGYSGYLNFYDDKDVSGGSGNRPNGNYRFTKLVWNGADSPQLAQYLMAGWSGYSSTYQGFLRTIWFKAGVRAASQQEVDSQTALASSVTNAANITTNTSAITTLTSSLATLTTTVGTQGTSITTNATALGTLTTNYGSLSSTVTTLGSTVSTNSTSITTLNTNVGTLTTRVGAGASNLLKNSGFEKGLANWTQGGSGGWGVTPNTAGGNPWGAYASVVGLSGAFSYVDSDQMPAGGGSVYTVSADMQVDVVSGSIGGYIQMIWYAGSTYNGESTAIYKTGGFTLSADGRIRLTDTAPPGTTSAALRFALNAVSGSGHMHVRQPKFEFASQMSPWTQEASVYQQSSAISTAEGQIASLSSTVGSQGSSITSNATAITGLTSSLGSLTTTVGTQGSTISSHTSSISTLNSGVATALARVALTLDVNGYTVGYEISNTGATGAVKFRTDLFEISSPSGGARTTFVNGVIRCYSASGALRVRIGPP